MTEVGASFAGARIQSDKIRVDVINLRARLEDPLEVFARVARLLSSGDVAVAVGSPSYSFRRQENISKTDHSEDRPGEEI